MMSLVKVILGFKLIFFTNNHRIVLVVANKWLFSERPFPFLKKYVHSNNIHISHKKEPKHTKT